MINKLIFVHDLCFYESEDLGIFTGAGLPEVYFDRFFNIGIKSVNIISRKFFDSTDNIIALGYSRVKNNRITLKHGCNRNYSILFNPFFTYKIYRLLKSSDFLVVSLPSIIGLYILILNLIVKKNYSIEVAGDDDMFSSKTGGWIITVILKIVMRSFVKKAKGVIYVTQYLSSKFKNDKLSIVASNVNIPSIVFRNSLTQPLLNNKVVNIGFVGGLVKRKGVAIILSALADLVENGIKNIKMHFVGGHADFEWTKIIDSHGLSKYIIFHGICDTEKVFQIYELFDIYLQPSYTEGLPRATIEAMSRGIPVIATALPGFEEILDQSQLIEKGNYLELSKLIKRLMEDFIFWNNCSRNNSNKAAEYLYEKLHFKRTCYYSKLFNDYI